MDRGRARRDPARADGRRLETGSVRTVPELQVVVDQLLAKQLESQKVVDVAGVCAKIRAALGLVGDSPGKDTPDRIFQRLGRGGR